MPKLRALVIGDAAVMRHLVSEVLSRDTSFEVAATAASGRAVLAQIEQIAPGVIVLDAEGAGLATLREIRQAHPALPVIVLAPTGSRGVRLALDALAAGASDHAGRPADLRNLENAVARLAAEIVPKVRALGGIDAQMLPVVVAARQTGPARGAGSAPVALVCVAASTGGPNALAEVCARFTQPPTVPLAMVQHMPAAFTAMLARRLDQASPHLRVVEVTDNEILEPGVAYLAPGGRHFSVLRDRAGTFAARLLDTPPENACRPSADVLFRSAARVAPGAVLAAVLTGMGHDGTRGSAAIRESGGHVVVQDETSSVVWGMPGSIVQAGLADAVVPLIEVAGEIARRIKDSIRPPGR